MVQEKGKYTVITGASSGIGYETAVDCQVKLTHFFI